MERRDLSVWVLPLPPLTGPALSQTPHLPRPPPQCPASPSLGLWPPHFPPHRILHPLVLFSIPTLPPCPQTSTRVTVLPSVCRLISRPLLPLLSLSPRHLPFHRLLCPSLQSRNGQVYLWGDTRLGPRRPACPLLATPDGPAHGSPRPAGHALRHLPLQLHRPQACALLGSTACLPGAAAGLGSLHCQDGRSQREQESRASEVLPLLRPRRYGAGAGRTAGRGCLCTLPAQGDSRPGSQTPLMPRSMDAPPPGLVRGSSCAQSGDSFRPKILGAAAAPG